MTIFDSIKSSVFVPIHPAGTPFIAIFAILTIFIGWLWAPLYFLGLILTVWCIYFFRNPNRVTPTLSGVNKNNLIIAPADGKIIENSDVAIYKGKILAVGKSLRIKDVFKSDTTGIKIIDAKEKHIASGIIDEHSHIAISAGVNESSQAVTAEVSIADVINPFDHNIYRQLAGGVTSSQLLHGSANPIGGQSALIKLRWGATAEEMKIKDSDGFIKFALGENVKQSNWRGTRFPQTRMGVEQVFYDAFYRAKNYKKEWNKFNNLSSRKKRITTPPREDLELNILSEILDNKRFITCHLSLIHISEPTRPY